MPELFENDEVPVAIRHYTDTNAGSGLDPWCFSWKRQTVVEEDSLAHLLFLLF